MPWGRPRRRAALVARLLVPPCPDCPANPGRWCGLNYWAEAILTDPGTDHFIHSGRMLAAIEGGWASYTTVAAQFTGPLPAALTRTITTARR